MFFFLFFACTLRTVTDVFSELIRVLATNNNNVTYIIDLHNRDVIIVRISNAALREIVVSKRGRSGGAGDDDAV